MPREWSLNQNVLIVGTTEQVAKANRHVQALIHRLNNPDEFKPKPKEENKDAPPKVVDHWSSNDDGPHEEWMDEYMYKIGRAHV